jgi:ABC-type glycerol-3-phosphate transport system substrate-binding protein
MAVRLRWILITVAAVLVIAVSVILSGNRAVDYRVKYAGEDLSVDSFGNRNTYANYLARYAGNPPGAGDINIDLFSYTDGEYIQELTGFAGEDRVLRTGENGFVEYRFRLDNPGFYNLVVEYFPIEGRSVDIERSVFINGGRPFSGAEQITLRRVWGDGSAVRTDNRGNQIRPSQIENPRWERAYFKDTIGYYPVPYQFYFSGGENTIRLEGAAEPVVLRKLTLAVPAGAGTYAEYISRFDLNQFQNGNPFFMEIIQGEDAEYRSDPSLNAVYDRSSGATEPASASTIKLNMIGGQSWRVAGQWIEWDFAVPEDGMYRFSIKARQNHNRGFVSSRSVMIDGVIPCAEAAVVSFKYNNKWTYTTLQDAGGNDLYFPLTKGSHSIRLEATLGGLGELLGGMSESIYRLNEMYRKILILTGAEPDPVRDYQIEVVYPDVIEAMALESKILYKLGDDVTAYTGERNAQSGVAITLARQLESFVEKPERIPLMLATFKGNIGALGDSLNKLSESHLDIDYLVVSAADARLPGIRDNLLTGVLHEIRSFLASFFMDYNNLGDVYGSNDDVVDVWIVGNAVQVNNGRDQSNVLKALIDDMFVPQTGIGVNLRLVAIEAVMPAVVAGTGPDIALGMETSHPVNYALRSAAMDLSSFDGVEDVTRRFQESALTSFRHGNGLYGLPETAVFNIMFCRTDILEELGLGPPETWEDLIKMLPALQRNNMNVAIPSLPGYSDPAGFLAFLYQNQGTLYSADGSVTLLDSETGIAAFDQYIKLFTHYKAPVTYDMINRFRTGEIPLAIADYTHFNTLAVFAPEIRGLWNFSPIPGRRLADGTIDRSAPVKPTASMMFSNAGNPPAAWEFLKWWTSADTQYRFGRELESVMGAAGRYSTANVEAFGRLPWSTVQLATLTEQMAWTVGTPEVPGSYYSTRHIVNAARKVYNDHEDSRETLLDYSQTINEELLKKRKELGLE